MADVCKLIVVGRLGGDVDLKNVNDTKVANFSVATNEVWKDKKGEKQERVEWTNVVVWGAQAEPCAKYLKKGHQVYVEGKKRTRSWDKDGVKHYAVELVAEHVTFLNNKESGGAPTGEPPPRGGQGEDDLGF